MKLLRKRQRPLSSQSLDTPCRRMHEHLILLTENKCSHWLIKFFFLKKDGVVQLFLAAASSQSVVKCHPRTWHKFVMYYRHFMAKSEEQPLLGYWASSFHSSSVPVITKTFWKKGVIIGACTVYQQGWAQTSKLRSTSCWGHREQLLAGYWYN